MGFIHTHLYCQLTLAPLAVHVCFLIADAQYIGSSGYLPILCFFCFHLLVLVGIGYLIVQAYLLF